MGKLRIRTLFLTTLLCLSVAVPASARGAAPKVIAISAGDWHTCALLNTGTVTCWGTNATGQLGDGTKNDGPTPVVVQNMGGKAKAIATGSIHSCALLQDGTVRCWGANQYGQLGYNTNGQDSTQPGSVLLQTAAIAISAGPNNTCAILVDHTAWCWGANGRYQLGNGSTTDPTSSSPVQVSIDEPATAISIGGEHACALFANGKMKCWGDNTHGQLGNGSISAVKQSTPVAVAGLTASVTAISAGYFHTCALLTTKRVMCWGKNLGDALGYGNPGAEYPTPGLAAGVSGVQGIDSDMGSNCVVAGGAAKCWGQNDMGQLGDGTMSNRIAAATVSGLGSNVDRITFGMYHGCVLLKNGNVLCWGDGGVPVLGNDATKGSLVPVYVVNVLGTVDEAGKPTPLWPPNNGFMGPARTILQWATTLNAAAYHIQVADNINFQSPKFEADADASTLQLDIHDYTGAFSDGPYYWRVVAANTDLEPGAYSKAVPFTWDKTPPNAPLLSLPADNSTSAHTPTFKWAAVRGAQYYKLFVGDLQTCNSAAYTSAWTTATSVKPPASAGLKGSYCWKVRAQDAAGNIGDWSDWQRADIVNP